MPLYTAEAVPAGTMTQRALDAEVMKPPGRASTSAGAPVTIVPVTTCW
jgi:hypothetical protein